MSFSKSYLRHGSSTTHLLVIFFITECNGANQLTDKLLYIMLNPLTHSWSLQKPFFFLYFLVQYFVLSSSK